RIWRIFARPRHGTITPSTKKMTKMSQGMRDENTFPRELQWNQRDVTRAAKLNPATLDAVLRKQPRQTDPNVLVGFDTNDDAGIYRISEDLALVQTVDFFTPIVDDPYLFGQHPAANALRDVSAMGGKPVSSLSIVGFPEKGDP